MARPIAYDRETVLNAAMLCFWQQGYTDCGMSDLELATGLSRSSIYNAFSSKKSLFLQALEHYIENVVYRRLSENLQDENPLLGIENYISGWFSFDSDHWGCLLINASTELGLHDENVRTIVNQTMAKVERKIRASLEQAQQRGQMAGDVDAGLLASSIGMQFTGMLVKFKVDYGQRWLTIALNSLRQQLYSTEPSLNTNSVSLHRT